MSQQSVALHEHEEEDEEDDPGPAHELDRWGDQVPFPVLFLPRVVVRCSGPTLAPSLFLSPVLNHCNQLGVIVGGCRPSLEVKLVR